MKRSKGNIVYTIIPILILGAAAAGGWYYYYAELNKNKSSEIETQSQQEIVDSLEKAQAKNKELEAALEREVAKIDLTTEELRAELEKRLLQQEQESKQEIANLKSRLEQELNESRVEVSQLKDQRTVIKLTSEVLFGSGSAEITLAGKEVLSIIADSLNNYPDRAITVEGHTDNIPVEQHPKYDSNWDLSTARGIAAIKFFQQHNEVDPKRLRVVGFGEFHPVASNESAEGRQLNRRIEIKLSPPE